MLLNATATLPEMPDGRGLTRKSDRFAWTDANVGRLKTLLAAGLSSSQIGADLGTSRNAVIGKKLRLGLCSPLSQAELRARADQRRVVTRRRRNQIVVSHVRLKPVQIPEPVAPSLEFKVTLFDLANNHCRYPLWGVDTPTAEKFFCGSPTVNVIEGVSYCPFHNRRVFSKREARS